MLKKTLNSTLSGIALAAMMSSGAIAGEGKVVTYLEVEAGAVASAVDLLGDYAEGCANSAGCESIRVLQRIGRDSHFVILEDWNTADARDAHIAGEDGQAIRSDLGEILTSAFDERPHSNLAVGDSSAWPEGAVVSVTHVDIVPTFKDAGIALVRQLASDSRGTPGNLQFDALTQESRTNHMTLVEAWESSEAQLLHASADYTRTMRRGLTPISGSLFDERLYAVIQ